MSRATKTSDWPKSNCVCVQMKGELLTRNGPISLDLPFAIFQVTTLWSIGNIEIVEEHISSNVREKVSVSILKVFLIFRDEEGKLRICQKIGESVRRHTTKRISSR